MTSIPFDWFLLLLRVLLIVLLYLFLYQIVRLVTRELALLARGESPGGASPARATRDCLVVIDPADSALPAGTVFPLAPVTLVGRHPRCTIALDEPFVSAEHAELHALPDRWQVRDLGSTNGTYVNGREVSALADVRDGDIVQFGRVKLQLMC